MKQVLDKVGAVGAFVTAAGCPACFPLLAVVGSALGLSFLKPHEGILMVVFQGLVVLSLIGNIHAYRNHKRMAPLVIGIISPVLIFIAFYVYFLPVILYAGLLGLLAAAIMNYLAKRQCRACQT